MRNLSSDPKPERLKWIALKIEFASSNLSLLKVGFLLSEWKPTAEKKRFFKQNRSSLDHIDGNSHLLSILVRPNSVTDGPFCLADMRNWCDREAVWNIRLRRADGRWVLSIPARS